MPPDDLNLASRLRQLLILGVKTLGKLDAEGAREPNGALSASTFRTSMRLSRTLLTEMADLHARPQK